MLGVDDRLITPSTMKWVKVGLIAGLLTVPTTILLYYLLGMTVDKAVDGANLTRQWFGILALIVVEVGLITPPVGMNLFIINGVARDIPIGRTYAGVAPFVLSDLIRVVILVAFPAITLWLVGVVVG